jgi:ubiquinone/menaquinone biosynthesis C-methylase UbiE
MDKVAVNPVHKANYNHYYEEGTSEWRRLGAIGKADNIISLCADLPHITVCEIGAGEGSILQRLSDLSFGNELFALEISKSGLVVIERRVIPRLSECRLFDGVHIPYEDNRFDLAILSHVVEHAEHPRQLLYEASRIARYLFVEVPLEDTIRMPYDFVVDQVGHINFYSTKTFRRLIQSSDLRVVRQITTNSPRETFAFQSGRRGLVHYYIREMALKVWPRIAARIFCYHGAIVCEKVWQAELVPHRGNARTGVNVSGDR